MNQESKNEILFVSTFPPRECGIATYTQDLMIAIQDKFGSSFSMKVCALENKPILRKYTQEVKYIMNTSNRSHYSELAKKINNDEAITIVFIQHEFGLFAGEYGEDVLCFLNALLKPVIVAFHTVIPQPDDKRKTLINAISNLAQSIVVMTENSQMILESEYKVSSQKISVIHHGTHLVSASDENNIKCRYHLRGKSILSTFGLLSSGKSIETALDAMPSIIKLFPNVVYLILGRTHPEIVKQEGEKYRSFLEAKVLELGIHDHVRFVNSYLSLADLLEYLQLTDIYLFTSKDQNQAVSGTFSYAMSCSCPVISTPIPHAKEMLNDDAGIIFDFQNSEQLAEGVIDLLSDPDRRKLMSLKALQKISPTSWQNSAIAHANLFRNLSQTKHPLKYSIPEISLDHIKKLTSQDGIIQFSEIGTPDLNSGYTLDDNARALIALTKHYELTEDAVDLRLIEVYLNFIKFAQQPNGKFLNYVDPYGNFHEKNKYVNLEDSMGRTIWALGEFVLHKSLYSEYLLIMAEELLVKSLPHITKLESPRAMSFALKGLYFFNLVKKSDGINFLIKELADELVLKYKKSRDSNWEWFENYLTYANSVIPEALLYAYLETGNLVYKNTAKSTFDFLLSMIFTPTNIKVISNRGWHSKGLENNAFGEQPIDVAYTIISLDLFYSVFRIYDYKIKMETAFSWFHGNNHLQQIIYNPVTGGCQDGLEEHNVNLNQGAESTICYLLARLTMEKYRVEEFVIKEEYLMAPMDSQYSKIEVNRIS